MVCGDTHITAQLLPLFSSPLHITAAPSRTRYLCLASKTDLTGFQQARLSQQATPTNSANPPMTDQTDRQKSGWKEASQNRKLSVERSTLSDTSRRSSQPIHQQGNDARPHGHGASWTAAHHCSAQQAAAVALGPASTPARICDISLWLSGQAQPHIQLRITLTPSACT
jgi:hypothetical protein